MTASSFEEAFEGVVIEDYEQVPREVEADEQTWKMQDIGLIKLAKGEKNIELYTNKKSITKDQIAEVKALRLEYIGLE